MFAQLPFMFVLFSTKKFIDAVENSKTIFHVLRELAPTRRQAITEVMGCYLDIIRGFWFMFYRHYIQFFMWP